jgi:hypothetical protein
MTAPGDPLDFLAAYLTPPDWHTDAACRSMGPALFFPDGTSGTAAPAKALCATCTTREPCRAAGEGEKGIWGGTSERDRRTIRSSGRLRPPAA